MWNCPELIDLSVLCQNTDWLHGDAVELDESKISRLYGFKCSRCRRIKNPVCPYSTKALEDKIESKAPKLEIYKTNSNPRVSRNLKEEVPVYSAVAVKEVDRVVADSHSPVLPPPWGSTDVKNADYGWKNSNGPPSNSHKLPVRRQIKQEKDSYSPFQVNMPAPPEANVLNSSGKLPVRRHTKKENNFDNYSAVNPHQVETPSTLEANPPGSVLDSLSSEIPWDVSNSNGSFDDGITLDYDGLGFDSMDFEPQTYFSFNELLASDDGSLTNPAQNLESAEAPENGMIEICYDEEEPMLSIETEMENMGCSICSHSEPSPDLSCQMCGMWIHSHCSPWVELEEPSSSSSWEYTWKCGSCREWT